MTTQRTILDEAETVAVQASSTMDALVAWARAEGVEWAIGAAVVAAVFVVLRLLKSFVARVIGSKKEPEFKTRNVVAGVVRATNSLFLLLLAVMIVLPFFVVLGEREAGWLEIAFTIIGALQVAIWVRVVALALIGRAADKHSAEESTLVNAMGVITVFINVAVFAVALIFILDNLGQDITAVIAGLGVGGIAVGLAAQSLFEDLFAGLSIILDKPFVRGDFVTFGDKSGTVEKVGLKSTRIRTLSGQQLAVNNSKLLDNEINNFRRMQERRIVTRIGVTYDTPHDKLERLAGQIREIVERQETVRFDRCHLAAYGDFSILYELVFYVLSREYGAYMDVQQRIFLDIHSLFEREGLDFAFPTQTVHVGSVPKGERAAQAREWAAE